ncbi:hypothetical protein M9435_002781 [Picochlorum sp. BPE23]|nr:hypothetical protein M9435_002781 [Picochlorum sp. BPE23]
MIFFVLLRRFIVLSVLLGLSSGQEPTEIINGGDGPRCDVETSNWSKDYKFATYKKETGAAFANRAIRALDDSNDVIRVRGNIKDVKRCFRACVDTKGCGTFTFVPELKECTLLSASALSSNKTNGKNLAQFCKSKGSIAGFIGYDKGNKENKAEKAICVDPAATCAKVCCGNSNAENCYIKSLTCTSTGTKCEC